MRRCLFPLLSLAMIGSEPARANDGQAAPRSRPIAEVLREPLPPERLTYAERDGRIAIAGPTFEYVVDRSTGAIVGLKAVRDDQPVVQLVKPSRLIVGQYATDAPNNAGETTAISKSPERIVLETKGTMKAGADASLPYKLSTTFFNDGVVVCEVALTPEKDEAVAEIRHEVKTTGAFRHHMHKARDDNGINSPWAALPSVGESAAFSTPTSCLQVFGPEAGLAIFTDRGASHASAGVDTAAVSVEKLEGESATLSLVQYIVREEDDGGFTLKANEPFTFRVGTSVAPSRLPHKRAPDLRMYAWIGDDKTPYPTDAEIHDAAQLGYNLFQMHRLGNPGEPRPPAEELDRVIKTVHDAGMLFIWTANADLMYGNAPGVQKMMAEGKWPLWQGFNYGGRYTDSMDAYCDLPATCLASPNGLADYRIETINAMLDKYDVDGMYIDDNLAYANCELQKEHGHPEKVYDCLIELHEMNWRRRQALLAKRPHAVLIDHCAKATIMPVISAFDGHLYGEGYTFPSVESYWAQYGALGNNHAHGCLWPGGEEADRSETQIAYNLDLLTGGGQYMYIDWRLYPEKFPHASGVSKDEAPLVRAYNLAQYGFGMYESKPHVFAESVDLFKTEPPGAYATIYRNNVWGDHLVVLANMSAEAVDASLTLRDSERLGLRSTETYAILDVDGSTRRRVGGAELAAQGISGVQVPGRGLKLFYLRPLADDAPRHLWGGKRISEVWDAESGTLTVELLAPSGAELGVFLDAGAQLIAEIRVNGEPTRFQTDDHLIRGKIRFGAEPVRVVVSASKPGSS